MPNRESNFASNTGDIVAAVEDKFELIPSAPQEFEDYLSSGERIRRSFGLENGGKYAYYDGGSAVMTYRAVASDGGKAMHEAAVRSLKGLHEVLKHVDFDALIAGEDSIAQDSTS